ECAVVPRPNGLVHELDRRFLLEFETPANGGTRVNQKPDAQGQICLTAEAANFLDRAAVVDDLEVLFVQIPHVVVVLVGHSENNWDLIDGNVKWGGIARVAVGLRRARVARGGRRTRSLAWRRS